MSSRLWWPNCWSFEVRDLEVNDPPIDQLIGELFRQGRL